jgi:hypothetical protein
MAMACFGLVTFLPLRPERSLPSFIARISVSTSLPAPREYFRVEVVLDAVLRGLLFFALVDFFFVAISFLLGTEMVSAGAAVAFDGGYTMQRTPGRRTGGSASRCGHSFKASQIHRFTEISENGPEALCAVWVAKNSTVAQFHRETQKFG